MKPISLLLLAMLSCAAGAATASDNWYACSSTSGKCPIPPVPPVPPTPPMPPMPPMPHMPPVPPVPPAPPAMPAIPAGAHAACAGKPDGAAMTYVIRKGEIMTGTCESEAGKMVFKLRLYSRDD